MWLLPRWLCNRIVRQNTHLKILWSMLPKMVHELSLCDKCAQGSPIKWGPWHSRLAAPAMSCLKKNAFLFSVIYFTISWCVSIKSTAVYYWEIHCTDSSNIPKKGAYTLETDDTRNYHCIHISLCAALEFCEIIIDVRDFHDYTWSYCWVFEVWLIEKVFIQRFSWRQIIRHFGNV